MIACDYEWEDPAYSCSGVSAQSYASVCACVCVGVGCGESCVCLCSRTKDKGRWTGAWDWRTE